MSHPTTIPDWKDKTLFTPGPLTTSRTVKQAMLRDLGSRDGEFIEIVREIRQRLLAIGGVNSPAYTAVLLQGSGTFAVEAVFSSCVPPHGKVLAIVNGAYGKRMVQMCQLLKVATQVLEYPEDRHPDPAEIARSLQQDEAISHVALVHCETTTGIINPVAEIGELVHQAGRSFFVDAMSSFGAVPLDLAALHIDYLVSSANKCIEGVPGFAFVLARTAALLATAGYARSLSFDLLAQYQGLEGNGQFRFTPPTHALLAFHQALIELEQEGGVAARAARYRQNHEILLAGMQALGFRPYLSPSEQGYIITAFYYPSQPSFNFIEFYQYLTEQGYTIYPGKVSNANCFRIGHIGHLFAADTRALLAAIGKAVVDLQIEIGERFEH